MLYRVLKNQSLAGYHVNSPSPFAVSTTSSHLETAVMTSSAGKTTGLRYLHKAQEGRCNPGDAYGIRTAEMCGLPWEIVEDARALRAQ